MAIDVDVHTVPGAILTSILIGEIIMQIVIKATFTKHV